MAKRIVTAIDVGTTKVATIVAKVDNSGGIQVLGSGVVPSHGLHKGMVVNPEEARRSIAESVRRAEQASGVRVDGAFVGVTGRHITSMNNKGVIAIPRSDGMVRTEDLKRVLSSAQTIPIPEDKRILHAIPRGYTLDGQERVRNPIGMHGFRLDVDTHIITAHVSSVQNLVKCVRAAGVEVDDLILEPLASGEACLSPEEKELGVILADIGGGTTDIAVYKDGSIYHTAVIPVAGYQFTSDLSVGLGLPFDVAESMKKKYANVSPNLDPKEAENTRIQNGHNISYVDLCHILRVRMEELLKLILLEMPTSDYMTLAPAGLVLTGGCSNMPGLIDLSQATIRMPTRIGEPSGVYGVTDVLSNPAYATGVGLLLWGTRSQSKTWQSRKRAGIFSGVMAAFRRLFR